MAFGGIIDIAAADGMARELASILPPRVRAPFTATFIRSAGLCDEFVHRLGVGIFRESGLAAAVAASPGTVDELVGRAGLEPPRARPPVALAVRRPGAPPRGCTGRRPPWAPAPPSSDPAPRLASGSRRRSPSWIRRPCARS